MSWFLSYQAWLMLQNAGPAPSPIGQMPPSDMPGGPMPNFFPVSCDRNLNSRDLA